MIRPYDRPRRPPSPPRAMTADEMRLDAVARQLPDMVLTWHLDKDGTYHAFEGAVDTVKIYVRFES